MADFEHKTSSESEYKSAAEEVSSGPETAQRMSIGDTDNPESKMVRQLQALTKSDKNSDPIQRVVRWNGINYSKKNSSSLNRKLGRVSGLSESQVEEIVDNANDSEKLYIYKGIVPELDSVKSRARRQAASSSSSTSAESQEVSEANESSPASSSGDVTATDTSLAPATSTESTGTTTAESDVSNESDTEVSTTAEANETTEVVSATVSEASALAEEEADAVETAHSAGRLMVHMVTGSLSTTPRRGRKKNAWQHDLDQVFGNENGLVASSNSLIPNAEGTSRKTIYTAQFGLLSTAEDDEIIVAGHRDLGVNRAKNSLTGNESESEIRTAISGSVGSSHSGSLVESITSLNNRSTSSADRRSPNNEVVYNLKPANLLGILINRKALKDNRFPGMNVNRTKRQAEATTLAEAIQEYVSETYSRSLPIYESDDGWKNISKKE